MPYATSYTNNRRRIALASVLVGLSLVFCGCSPQAREARYLASGKKMMEQNDYRRAVIQFMNAVKMMPKDAEAHYRLALAYLASGNYPAAVKSLSKAVDLNPKHRGAQLKLAEIYSAAPADTKGRQFLEKSQKAVQDLLNSGESSAEILDTLATTELKLGDQEAAEKTWQQALAKFPKDLAATVQLARIKLAHKDPTGAEELLKKTAAQQPPSANAFLALGQFYVASNRAADAEARFRRATEIDPKGAPALLALAVLQARTGKLDQAGQTYARLSGLPDERFRAYHAAFLAARGQHGEAIKETEALRGQHPDNRAIRSLLVREYLTTQKRGDAEKLLTAALQKNGKDFDALIQRASLYLTTGRADDAQKDLSLALHFRNDSAEAHYLMSKVNEAHGAVSNQRAELGEALRLRPDFLQARLQLARTLMASGDAQAALDLMNTREGQAQKNNLAYVIQRNWALLALKQTGEARKEVDRGLAVVRSPDLLLQDAYLKIQQNDYSAARASLVEVLNRSPEDVRALRLIVASYTMQKDMVNAVRTVQQYAGQHPKSAPVHEFLAELLLANGERAGARTALLAAKTADPNFTPAALTLAQLDAAEGHVNEATKALSTILVKSPQNVPARMLLANLEDMRGNRTAAIDGYKKILESQPANVLVLNNLAFDLVEYGNQPDEALNFAQKAAELAPDAPAVENTLGWVLYRKGLYSLALPHLEKAADKEPNARRKCHLAMAYLRMGDQERGEKNLAAAMKLDPNIPEIRTAQQILDEMHGAR